MSSFNPYPIYFFIIFSSDEYNDFNVSFLSYAIFKIFKFWLNNKISWPNIEEISSKFIPHLDNLNSKEVILFNYNNYYNE